MLFVVGAAGRIMTRSTSVFTIVWPMERDHRQTPAMWNRSGIFLMPLYSFACIGYFTIAQTVKRRSHAAIWQVLLRTSLVLAGVLRQRSLSEAGAQTTG